MSWSASFTYRQPHNGEAGSSREFTLSNTQVPENKDQYEHALDVAMRILSSGVVGSTDKTFKVNLSGHGNPNHEPKTGWANDQMTISVTQVGSPPVEETA